MAKQPSAPRTTDQAAAAPPTLQDVFNSILEHADPMPQKSVVQFLNTFAKAVSLGILTIDLDKPVGLIFQKAIEKVDGFLGCAVTSVLQSPQFRQLEGAWRGLQNLVANTQSGESLKIKVIQATAKDLKTDLDKALDIDQSQLFKKIYTEQYGMPGGEPFSALIGDYYVDSIQPADDPKTNVLGLDSLQKVAAVAADAFAPFVSSVSPGFFGFKDWSQLPQPRDIGAMFSSLIYAQWNDFRQNDPDSRYVSLAMPRVLARLPYGSKENPVSSFNYEELPLSDYPQPGNQKVPKYALEAGLDQFTWSNAAYAMASRMTIAFAQFNWTTAIRGLEGGGKVENLPLHYYWNDGAVGILPPTEVAIPDRREFELDKAGYLTLSWYKNQPYAVFFGGNTVQKPLKYDLPAANANAELSARLPYQMAASRIAHFLKIQARDKIGSFMSLADLQAYLNRWIAQYVLVDPHATQDAKSRYPLAAASVLLKEVSGKPGSYQAIVYLRPFLQFEELTASIRLVAKIPPPLK